MGVRNEKFLLETNGFNDIIDITLKVDDVIKQSAQRLKDKNTESGTKSGEENIKNAVIHIFSPGSTVSITTIEYEPGLIKDIPEILNDLIPENRAYHHDKTWHDGNGYAHLRASIIGNGITVPYVNGELELGTWQQIVLIDFDNKPRTRSVIVQVVY